MLPPYHPELNAIETAWGVVKNHVGRTNDPSLSFNDMKNVINEGIKKCSIDTWVKLDNKVCRKEEKQRVVLQKIADKRDAFRKDHPDLIFTLSSDSESENEGPNFF